MSKQYYFKTQIVIPFPAQLLSSKRSNTPHKKQHCTFKPGTMVSESLMVLVFVVLSRDSLGTSTVHRIMDGQCILLKLQHCRSFISPSAEILLDFSLCKSVKMERCEAKG